MRQDQAMRPEREGVRQAEPAGQLLRQCDGPGLVTGRIFARHLRLTRGLLQATWQPSRLLRMVGHSFGYVPRQASNRILKPRPLAVAASRRIPVSAVQFPEHDVMRRIGSWVVCAEPHAAVGGRLEFRQRLSALMGKILKTGPSQCTSKFNSVRGVELNRKRESVGESEFHGQRSLVVEIAVSGSAADAGSLAGGGLRRVGFGIEPANFVAGGFVEPHGIALGELFADGFDGLARPCRTLRHQRRQVFGGYRTVHQANGALADRFLDLDHCVSPVYNSAEWRESRADDMGEKTACDSSHDRLLGA